VGQSTLGCTFKYKDPADYANFVVHVNVSFFKGLIYKMLHRNHPAFDLTIISQMCVGVIKRTNYSRSEIYKITSYLEFVHS